MSLKWIISLRNIKDVSNVGIYWMKKICVLMNCYLEKLFRREREDLVGYSHKIHEHLEKLMCLTGEH
jgi:hypothetical protein